MKELILQLSSPQAFGLRLSDAVPDATKAKIQLDTTANWNSKPDFRPAHGLIVVYTDHGQMDEGFGNTINVPAIKIGDGSAYLIDLPFVGDDVRYQILTEIRLHTNNHEIHVTPVEREFWNNKLNCIVNNGNLILNRM